MKEESGHKHKMIGLDGKLKPSKKHNLSSS